MPDRKQYNPAGDAAPDRWAARLRALLPEFLDRHPDLADCWRDGALVLYGSLTQGIDDAWCDVDAWLLLPDATASTIQTVDTLLGSKDVFLTLV